MSIQSEISRISTNVDNSLSAVAEMGGTVAANATSDDLQNAIRTIPAIYSASVLYSEYAPGGTRFSQEIAIDWDRECIEASIDLSTATGSNENVLSVGLAIAQWAGNNVHVYYNANGTAGLLQMSLVQANSLYARYELANVYGNVLFTIDKYGISINGVCVTDTAPAYGNSSNTANVADAICASDTVQIGSLEGTTGSNAIYNYIVKRRNTVIDDTTASSTTTYSSEKIEQMHAELSGLITSDAYQEGIVQQVITALGTPVFGTVDADNNIILSGDLADGTYTVKYEDAEGNITDIGTIEQGGSSTFNVPITWIIGTKLSKTTGAVESTTATEYNASDFITLVDGASYVLATTNDCYNSMNVVYYNDSNTFVGYQADLWTSNQVEQDQGVPRSAALVIPSGATKIRLRQYEAANNRGWTHDLITLTGTIE